MKFFTAILRSLITTFLLFGCLSMGEIQVEVKHQFDGKVLRLSSLSYEAGETFSVTRLSYLLSDFAVANDAGERLELKGKQAYIDLESRRNKFVLNGVPDGEFSAIQFSIGLDKEVNHSDPALYATEHPLNPNLNNLHWTWQDGYIFLALEGMYRKQNDELGGYVFHYANDWNKKRIELPVDLTYEAKSALVLRAHVTLCHCFT